MLKSGVQLDPRLVVDLHVAGYRGLLPVAPPGAEMSPNSKVEPGKVPSDLGPHGWRGVAGWTDQAYPTDQLQYQVEKHGAGLGLNTTQHPYLDVDVTDADLAAAIEATLSANLHFSLKRIGRAPKFAVPCRLADGVDAFPKMVLRLRDAVGQDRGMIEVLADKRFIVVAGQHPRTGRPYVWQKGEHLGGVELLAETPPESLTPISPAVVMGRLLPALAECLRPFAVTISREGGRAAVQAANVDQESIRSPLLARLAEVVMAIPNEADHDAYIAMGRAIRGAAGEDRLAEGLEIYEEWASRGTDGTGGTHPPDQVWDTLRPPHALGWPYILNKSQGHINTAPDVFEADPNAVPPPEVPPLIARLNDLYIVVSDGIYCTRDRKVRSPDRVRLFLASEPGAFAQWHSHPQRVRAHSIVFDPARPPLTVTEEC